MSRSGQNRVGVARKQSHVQDAWGITVSELQASRMLCSVRPQIEGKEDSDDGCSETMLDEILSLSELAFWMDYDDLDPCHSNNGEFLF